MTFKKNTEWVGIGTNSPLAKLDIYDSNTVENKTTIEIKFST